MDVVHKEKSELGVEDTADLQPPGPEVLGFGALGFDAWDLMPWDLA